MEDFAALKVDRRMVDERIADGDGAGVEQRPGALAGGLAVVLDRRALHRHAHEIKCRTYLRGGEPNIEPDMTRHSSEIVHQSLHRGSHIAEICLHNRLPNWSMGSTDRCAKLPSCKRNAGRRRPCFGCQRAIQQENQKEAGDGSEGKTGPGSERAASSKSPDLQENAMSPHNYATLEQMRLEIQSKVVRLQHVLRAGAFAILPPTGKLALAHFGNL